ncbi:MAG: relaxase domain-containing protein [Actinomycetota bacterium]|nr:relaxase domain-containing protein [Actinomycetota bacterium]
MAQGAEDYYAGEGEAPGVWLGAGAAELGLRGHVGEQAIARLLDARDPGTGESLRQPLASGAVAGFDLTFRAPKSVSVLYGIADPAIMQEIRGAHDRAVRGAVAYLEREACRTRRGHGGAVVVDGRGFVAAAFEHRSSRAGDPLLHTHVVVANATQGPDGRWTALDGRALYGHAKTAGYLYQAELRAELSERLRVRWHPVERGTADVIGVPRGVIEHFSRRRPRFSRRWPSVVSARRGRRRSRRSRRAAARTTTCRSPGFVMNGGPAPRSTAWAGRACGRSLAAAGRARSVMRGSSESPVSSRVPMA